jgi:hypothetical protein
VLIPASVVKWAPHRLEWNNRFQARGSRVYDNEERSYAIPEAIALIEADIVSLLPWDDCPEVFNRWACIRAARVFSNRAVGNTATYQLTQADEDQAWADLLRVDTEQGQPNAITGDAAWATFRPAMGLGRRRGGGGGWSGYDGSSLVDLGGTGTGSINLPQALGQDASPTFAGLTLSAFSTFPGQLCVLGTNGAVNPLPLGSGLSIVGGALVAAGGGGGGSGTAATISVGTVTTGAAGSSATVTNVGTTSAAVFNFSIPRGDTGLRGPYGTNGSNGSNGAAATVSVGSVTTGAAGSSASVTNTGTSGAAVFAFTIPRGDAGTNGTNGTNGAAATVSVGSVTTGAAGSSASVTNTGTSGAAVFAFTIPRGDTGPAGPVAGSTGQIIYNNAGSAGGLTPLGLAISGTNLATLADLIIPLSGETSGSTVSTLATIPYWPRTTVLTDVPIWAVATAPTGAAMQFDIKVGGTSIFTATLPTIATGVTNSTASGSIAGTFSSAFTSAGSSIAAGSVVTFHLTQQATSGGVGLKVAMPTRRAG